ncbi:MAG: hypothetical protein QM673_17035 [Gordonia sp. (in: high G+C Gram-positive bacteria)]
MAAVERGGRGEGAAALSALFCLASPRIAALDPAFASLALSTMASLYRQSGRHGVGRRLDGQALALLPAVAHGLVGDSVDDAWVRIAHLDARTGLAADNLGIGSFAASERLLDGVRDLLVPAVAQASSPAQDPELNWLGVIRPRLRWHWVSAELAMYTGRPAAAVEHATAGVRLLDSVEGHDRHRIKTDLIAAAAYASAGDVARAAALAASCESRARTAGLVPLTWAALALRSGVDDASAQEAAPLTDVPPADTSLAHSPLLQTVASLAQAHDMLVSRGMPFAPRSPRGV